MLPEQQAVLTLVRAALQLQTATHFASTRSKTEMVEMVIDSVEFDYGYEVSEQLIESLLPKVGGTVKLTPEEWDKKSLRLLEQLNEALSYGEDVDCIEWRIECFALNIALDYCIDLVDVYFSENR